MFFRKVTSKSNGKEYTYVKLIENYREGNKVKQRVVANLGNIEDLTPEKVQGLISGLTRICGLYQDSDNIIESKKVLQFGEVLAIHKIWESLGVSRAITNALQNTGKPNIPLLVELMVMNQIIKPRKSKNVSDWYRCLYLPQLEGKNLTVEQFNTALDLLVSAKEPLEDHIFETITKAIPADTETVFCHLTRGYFEKSEDEATTARSKYLIGPAPERKLVEMGILVSREGMPIGHHIFPCNFSDEIIISQQINRLKNKYSIEKCIFVGNQSAINEDNLQLLAAYGHQYIVGLELRFNREVERLQGELRAPADTFIKLNNDLSYKELTYRGNRYLICFNSLKAAARQKNLENRLNSIERELIQIKKWVKEQFGTNAKANFYRASNILKDTYCKRYFDCWYDENTHEFDYLRKQDIIDREYAHSGKFVLKTNNLSLPAPDAISAFINYIEAREEFRVIKNYEPFPEENWDIRISGHVFICVLAHLIEKTLEHFLNRHGMSISARKALEALEDIKVTVSQLQNTEIKSITPAYGLQKEILSALGIDQIPKTLEKESIPLS